MSQFAITAQIAAPRAAVWRAWSEAEQLAAWWGPQGCTLSVAALEFRPGGIFHYAMAFGAAPPMWGRFVYREIVAAERIVYLSGFANAGGGLVRAPFPGEFPLEYLGTVTLADDAGGTRIDLTSQPVGPTPGEQAQFDGMHESLRAGFGGTFRRLAAHLGGT